MSGSGYGGPFSGPGFDSMWTDMSEIVRPTRDGIHGREYISTSVDIGRKLPYLAFRDGQLAVALAAAAGDPMPVIFDVVPGHWRRGPVLESIALAAAELGTMAVIGAGDGEPSWREAARGHVIPLVDAEDAIEARCASEDSGSAVPALALSGFNRAPLLMVPDDADVMTAQAALKAENAEQIVAIRLPATPAAAQRVLELARQGAEVVHLVFDAHGRETGRVLASGRRPRHPCATCCVKFIRRWSRPASATKSR